MHYSSFSQTGGEYIDPAPDTRSVFVDRLHVYCESAEDSWSEWRVTLYCGLVSYGAQTYSSRDKAYERAGELASLWPSACSVRVRRFSCVQRDPF